MRMVIAGGGTGGHLFPGMAVAEEFLKRDPSNRVMFIGTRKGIEYRVLGKSGYTLQTVDIEGLKGRGLKALLHGLYTIPKSMWASRGILRAFAPDLVVGVGGYASGPAVMAACLMGLPTAIAEQNAQAGYTNRILGKFVRKIFVTYAESREMFPADKVLVTGNPVRAGMAVGTARRSDNSEDRHLLIFGGSQGAAAINRAATAMLPRVVSMNRRLRIVHQTGEKDRETVARAYALSGVEAEVVAFIDDMAKAYARADLVICRAGATSLAEITVAGKAAVLIPFPYAADDHQTKNAESLAHAGAAVMIRETDLTSEKLFDVVNELICDDLRRSDMEAASRAEGRPDAAKVIVDACLVLAGAKNRQALRQASQ